MLIARLIADPVEVETRLDGAVLALVQVGLALNEFSATDNDRNVFQFSFEGGSSEALRKVIEDQFAPQAAVICEGQIAAPQLFVSDMDSTMIGQECIDELADFAGLKDHVAAITERAMQGELDFESALRERVALLAGLDEGAISQCLEERIHPVEGARTLVQTLKAMGCRTALVTGGFHHFADAVAGQLGFDRVVGNRLAIDSGKLTGGLEGPIADSSTKLAVLDEERSKIADCRVLASGDGANDIPMLKAADYGFAYRAKPLARSASSGWIDSGDLTQILRLLGIPESDWRH